MSGTFVWTGAFEPDQIAQVTAAKRVSCGCIVLGRGKNGHPVHAWLAIAAGVPGFVGLVLGRATLWKPLIALRDKKITREAPAGGPQS
jgi:hypothetical protein